MGPPVRHPEAKLLRPGFEAREEHSTARGSRHFVDPAQRDRLLPVRAPESALASAEGAGEHDAIAGTQKHLVPGQLRAAPRTARERAHRPGSAVGRPDTNRRETVFCDEENSI